MPTKQYYEARIVRKNGIIWAGHIGPTKEEARKAANKALAADSGGLSKSDENVRIDIYHCTLTDSIPLTGK